MMGGDAAMVVALADSLFFNIDLDAARSRVMLFLVISFAPFLVIAPLIGPLIDRVAGGRRLVIQLMAGARIVLMILMASYIDALALFPLVFASLVLQKTYVVSKSALVPSTVRTARRTRRGQLEARSDLGHHRRGRGDPRRHPAQGVRRAGDALVRGDPVRRGAVRGDQVGVRMWSPEHDVDTEESTQLAASSLQLGAIAMTILRANVGLHVLPPRVLAAVAGPGRGVVRRRRRRGRARLDGGNAIAPKVRTRLTEESMLSVGLVVSAVSGLAVAVLGGPIGAVVLAGVLNLAAALGRLSFESMVQRDAPGANQGRAFARFETRFQLAWAVGAFLAVAIQVDGRIGFVIVGVVSGVTMLYLIARRNGRDFSPRVTRASQRPGASISFGVGTAEAEVNNGREAVLAGAVDDTLNEVLAACGLLVAEPDAEQTLDEDVVRGRLGPAAASRLGDLQGVPTDDPHGDGVDDPVDHADGDRDRSVEQRFHLDLLLRADCAEQHFRIAECGLHRRHRIGARRRRAT